MDKLIFEARDKSKKLESEIGFLKFLAKSF